MKPLRYAIVLAAVLIVGSWFLGPIFATFPVVGVAPFGLAAWALR
jgi:hypothetical protein